MYLMIIETSWKWKKTRKDEEKTKKKEGELWI